MKKLTKKALSIALCIIMLMSTFVIGITASAANANSGNCGDNLTWTLDDKGTLTISGTGDMYNYDINYDSPWYFNKDVKVIIIDNGVTSIGGVAFGYCENLTKVTIPDSVTNIGEGAFMDCTRLTSVIIPSGVTAINKGTFIDCSSLISITIPKSVIIIETSAFSHCSSLKDVNYSGSEKDKNNIYVADYNSDLMRATWHYAKNTNNIFAQISSFFAKIIDFFKSLFKF